MSYNVVIKDKQIRFCTWTPFENKRHLQRWFTPEIQAINEVVAQELSEKECIELCHNAPLSDYIHNIHGIDLLNVALAQFVFSPTSKG